MPLPNQNPGSASVVLVYPLPVKASALQTRVTRMAWTSKQWTGSFLSRCQSNEQKMLR
jgi:hypothetical protein